MKMQKLRVGLAVLVVAGVCLGGGATLLRAEKAAKSQANAATRSRLEQGDQRAEEEKLQQTRQQTELARQYRGIEELHAKVQRDVQALREVYLLRLAKPRIEVALLKEELARKKSRFAQESAAELNRLLAIEAQVSLEHGKDHPITKAASNARKLNVERDKARSEEVTDLLQLLTKKEIELEMLEGEERDRYQAKRRFADRLADESFRLRALLEGIRIPTQSASIESRFDELQQELKLLRKQLDERHEK